MDLVDRFRYIMKLNQLSASAFADKIGVQRSSVSHVLSGRNKPSLEFIQKVLRNFPRVDANWLVDGSTKGAADKVISAPNDLFETKETTKAIEQPEENVATKTEEETTRKQEKQRVQRIVVFYTDNTFEEFKP